MHNVAAVFMDTLLLRLQKATKLPLEDGQALCGLPWRIEDYSAHADIAGEGSKPGRCCSILEGFTVRHTTLQNGKRHIQSYNVPGDMPDLHSLQVSTMDHTLGALSDCKLAFVAHGPLRALCHQRPHLADALWRETLIDAATFRTATTRIAQLSAKQRLAHLLCEAEARLEAVGRIQNGKFNLPVTQELLGEFLGLSTVQINRSIQELRSDELLKISRHEIHILDRSSLRNLAEFDPLYLHLSH